MNPGELNQRVTIQRRATGLDAAGQESATWESLPSSPEVWAKVQPMRGRDLVAAAQAQATYDARVTIRYRADVQATMRLLWNGAPLEIVGEPINVDGAGAWLELMCTHGVRAGAQA